MPRTLIAGLILLIAAASPSAPAAPSSFAIVTPGGAGRADEPELQLSQSPSPGKPPAGETRRVTYRVSGQAASTTIDYRTRGGPIEHSTTLSLPWAVSLDMPAGDPLHVTASGRAAWGETTVACEILVDGVVQAKATGTGFTAVATCKARADR
jgi:hypothetical protein